MITYGIDEKEVLHASISKVGVRADVKATV
jgi:hypothetical protein